MSADSYRQTIRQSSITAGLCFAAVGLTIMALFAAPAAAAQVYQFAGKLNSGYSYAQLATDRAGNVYVAGSRIEKRAPTGSLITQWGATPGTGNGQFASGLYGGPGAIATDPPGNVYVSDPGNFRVQKFTSTGKFVTKWGSHGTGDGRFGDFGPGEIATDGAGNVYVVDGDNHRVQKFTSTGKFVTKWGSNGTGNGQFRSLEGIATDRAGKVYVVDPFDDYVKKFTSTGAFITKWRHQFGFVDGVATDSANNVYVADLMDYHRVVKFTSTGSFITYIGGPGSYDGGLVHPSAVAIGAGGRVYVGDRDRVQWFVLDKVAPTTKITASTVQGKTKRQKAKFWFAADDKDSKFRCKLDKRRYGPCTSPKTYRRLKLGRHVFRVHATDPAGNVGKPARRVWKVVRNL